MSKLSTEHFVKTLEIEGGSVRVKAIVKDIVCIILIAILLLIQGVCWQSFFTPNLSIHKGFVGLIFVASGILLSAVLYRYSKRYSDLYFWTFLSLTFLIPFYGALGSVFVAVFMRYMPEDNTILSDFSDYIDPDDELDELFVPSESVSDLVHHQLEVQSYYDILNSSNRGRKKALITKILMRWKPEEIRLLRIAVKDPDYEIGTYASTALNTIEKQISSRILKLQNQIGLHKKSVSLHLSLADVYLDYIDTGLLDKSSANYYLVLADELIHDIDPERVSSKAWETKILLVKGRIARLAGDTVAEFGIYEKVLALYPDHQETIGHYCAALFRTKRYGELKRWSKQLVEASSPDASEWDSAVFWAGERKSDG